MDIGVKRNADIIISSLSFLLSILLMSTMLASIGVMSSSISSGIQLAIVGLVTLVEIVVKKNVSVSLVIGLAAVIGCAVINLAPYMLSLAMIISLTNILSRINSETLKSVANRLFYVMFIAFILVIILNRMTGFGEVDISIWRINRLVSRQSLGFVQPNVTLLTWLGIIFLGVFSCDAVGKRRTIRYAIMMVMTFFLYKYTVSRTSTYVATFVLMTSFFWGNKYLNLRSVQLINLLPLSVFTVSIDTLFSSKFDSFNSILSGRISLYRQFYAQYGVSMTKESALENAMFDNGYLQALLAKGWLFTILEMTIFMTILHGIKRLRVSSAVIYIAFFLVGFTETALQRFELLIPLIMCISFDRV